MSSALLNAARKIYSPHYIREQSQGRLSGVTFSGGHGALTVTARGESTSIPIDPKDGPFELAKVIDREVRALCARH